MLAVAHNDFKRLSVQQIKSLGKKNHIIYDLKFLLDLKDTDLRP